MENTSYRRCICIFPYACSVLIFKQAKNELQCSNKEKKATKDLFVSLMHHQIQNILVLINDHVICDTTRQVDLQKSAACMRVPTQNALVHKRRFYIIPLHASDSHFKLPLSFNNKLCRVSKTRRSCK